MADKGTVYFIGTGPGTKMLATPRAGALLENCDVVVYDSGVQQSVLAGIGEHCEQVDVGNMSGAGPSGQEHVGRILADHASRGARVARLFGGDPFLTPELGAEAVYCASAGIDFEMIPGVSLVSSACAAAGIPLLQTGVANSLLITGGPYTLKSPPKTPEKTPAATPPRRPGVHIRRRPKIQGRPPGEASLRLRKADVFARQESGLFVKSPGAEEVPSFEEEVEGFDWKTVGSADTVVMLEPQRHLSVIQKGLELGGRSGGEPVALIDRRTLQGDEPHLTTIKDLPESARYLAMESPVILIVGDVVNLREVLITQRHSKALAGLAIGLVAGEKSDSSLADSLRAEGAFIEEFSLFRSVPVQGVTDELPLLSDDFRFATHVVVTNDASVSAFFLALEETGLDIRILSEQCRVFGCGSEATRELRRRGLRADEIESLNAKALFGENPARLAAESRVVLLGRVGEEADFAAELRGMNARVTVIPLVEHSVRKPIALEFRGRLHGGKLNAVLFLSGDAVQAAVDQWSSQGFRRLVHNVMVVPCTSGAEKALKQAGIEATRIIPADDIVTITRAVRTRTHRAELTPSPESEMARESSGSAL